MPAYSSMTPCAWASTASDTVTPVSARVSEVVAQAMSVPPDRDEPGDDDGVTAVGDVLRDGRPDGTLARVDGREHGRRVLARERRVVDAAPDPLPVDVHLPLRLRRLDDRRGLLHLGRLAGGGTPLRGLLHLGRLAGAATRLRGLSARLGGHRGGLCGLGGRLPGTRRHRYSFGSGSPPGRADRGTHGPADNWGADQLPSSVFSTQTQACSLPTANARRIRIFSRAS